MGRYQPQQPIPPMGMVHRHPSRACGRGNQARPRRRLIGREGFLGCRGPQSRRAQGHPGLCPRIVACETSAVAPEARISMVICKWVLTRAFVPGIRPCA